MDRFFAEQVWGVEDSTRNTLAHGHANTGRILVVIRKAFRHGADQLAVGCKAQHRKSGQDIFQGRSRVGQTRYGQPVSGWTTPETGVRPWVCAAPWS